MSDLPILNITVESTASGKGWSYWSRFLFGCPKTRHLPAGEAMQIGSYFGRLCEHYYDGDFETHAVEPDLSPVAVKAWELFRFYRAKHRRHEWDTVLQEPRFASGCELESEPLDRWAETSRLRVRCERRYGVPEFTGAIDQVLRISEEQARNMMLTRPELGILQPGVYNHDFKTAGRGGQPLEWDCKTGKYWFQAIGYQMLLEEHRPDLWEDFRGSLFTCVVKTKTPQIKSYLVPKKTEEDEELFRNTLAKCYELYKLYGDDMMNPAACTNYGGCPMNRLKGGDCR